MNNDLIENIDMLHTTQPGAERIRRNLALTDAAPVEFCRSRILDRNALFCRRGKNWYVRAGGCVITVNASRYTIITAHRDGQIGRISKYEAMMDEARELLASGRMGEKLFRLIGALEAYYQSPRWKRDFADDEAGLIPADVKRGVLSEDGIYDLLESFRELSGQDPEERVSAAARDTVLETERLILRPWTEADAEECYRYARDPRVGPSAGWPVHTSAEESRQVIRNILAVPETYAIVLKETGLPVGSISLHFHSDLAERDDEAELGYWLGVPYWGRGIVPEAAREVLRHAFEDLSLSRVWCGYYEGNEKSKRVQEKLGFRHQRTREDAPVPQMGETRRGHVNRLTREEWQEGKP